MEKRRTVLVSEDVWRLVKQAALDEGGRVQEVVDRKLREALTPDSSYGRDTVVQARNREAALGGSERETRTGVQSVDYAVIPDGPDSEAQCKYCRAPWKDHQGGASGKLAVSTNCRAFRWE